METDEPAEQPWWVGTEYEVLDPLVGPCQDEFLQAAYTPNNGIRISIWDEGDDCVRSFDLSAEQAKFVGEKLIKWAAVDRKPDA